MSDKYHHSLKTSVASIVELYGLENVLEALSEQAEQTMREEIENHKWQKANILLELQHHLEFTRIRYQAKIQDYDRRGNNNV
jgi:lipoate-protein ligase A